LPIVDAWTYNLNLAPEEVKYGAGGPQSDFKYFLSESGHYEEVQEISPMKMEVI